MALQIDWTALDAAIEESRTYDDGRPGADWFTVLEYAERQRALNRACSRPTCRQILVALEAEGKVESRAGRFGRKFYRILTPKIPSKRG